MKSLRDLFDTVYRDGEAHDGRVPIDTHGVVGLCVLFGASTKLSALMFVSVVGVQGHRESLGVSRCDVGERRWDELGASREVEEPAVGEELGLRQSACTRVHVVDGAGLSLIHI